MLVNFFQEVPGLSQAVKRENDLRDAAFLDLSTEICGVRICQMTALDLLVLDGVDNALVQGRLPSPDEICFFLWQLAERGEKRFGLWLFARRVRRMDYPAALSACRKFITDTFQDSPGGGGRARPFASWLAHSVNLLAMNYGWSESDILKIPLKRIFQYQRCIQRYNNPNSILHNPSDRLIGGWLKARNEKLASQN